MGEELPIKIDGAGRIVIPRKIREKFDIQGNEYLSVVLEEKSFLLCKKDNQKQYFDFINKIKRVELLYELDFVVTDKEKVVYASKRYELIKNEKISKELLDMFGNEHFDNSRIRLTDDYILGSSYCYCVSSVGNYTKFLIIVPFRNKDEKKLANLVLKLLS